MRHMFSPWSPWSAAGRRRWRPAALALVSLAPALGGMGCRSESLIPPVEPDQRDLYWALALNHRAVLLSTTTPYDTLTLVATPQNYRGEPLTGAFAPQYTSKDPEHVLVSNNGALVAVAPTTPGQPVWVVATLTANNLRHVDSVAVHVVDNPAPPVLTYFSAHRPSPDSAKLAASMKRTLVDTLPVQALDADHTPIPDVPVAFWSSDTLTADVENDGTFWGNRPGRVTLYASTTVFGVTKTDTIPYRIGWPILGFIDPSREPPAPGKDSVNFFLPHELVIGTGGLVVFGRPADQSVDFDLAFNEADFPNIAPASTWGGAKYYGAFAVVCWLANCEEDDDGLAPAGMVRWTARVFSKPGTYEYQSTSFGAHGTITVIDDAEQ